MSAIQNATDHLTLGAYATVGVLDSTRKQAIDLVERREELPKELQARVETLRTQVTETLDELKGRLETQRKDTRKRIEGYAGQGKVVVTNLRGNTDETIDRVRSTTEKALAEVRDGDFRGAVKVAQDELKVGSPKEAATKTAKKVEAKALTASQLNKKTKAELLDLAAAEDVNGRSNMTKAELVKALS